MNDRADTLAKIGSKGRYSLCSERGFFRHINLQKRLSFKSKYFKCSNTATKYFRRPGLLLCNVCSPKDDYFGVAVNYNKPIINELNNMKDYQMRKRVDVSGNASINGMDNSYQESQNSDLLWEKMNYGLN